VPTNNIIHFLLAEGIGKVMYLGADTTLEKIQKYVPRSAAVEHKNSEGRKDGSDWQKNETFIACRL
ncbi:MAG: hypothetical protein AAF244_05040, partial [Pseudomonadota bacterium]